MTRAIAPIGIFALGLAACALALWRTALAAPVPWILGADALALLASAVRLRGTARVLAVNLGLTALVLLGFELYLLQKGGRPEEIFSGTYTSGYWERHHPVLGYAPAPGRTSTATKHQAGELVYAVTYTITGDGLRLAPPHRPDAAASIVFFGDSHTFGEGVEDDETAPYRVGLRTEGRLAVYNFGFHGYGPHHMLAALEAGYAAARIRYPPRHVIFVTGDYHDARVMGSPWDPDGPRYRLGPDGRLVRAGSFREHRDLRQRLRARAERRAERSGIARAFLERVLPEHRSNRDLYVAVVDSAGRAATRAFPGADFHVLFWDNTARAGAYIAALAARGLRVHPMSRALPRLADDPHGYQLSPLDGHPTPAAHDLIARYIVETIIATGE
jgi:hypothetical protein